MTVVLAVVAVLLAATVACAMYRIVRGPTILDRMIASDVVLTTLVITLGVHMVATGRTDTWPVLLVVAASASFATIAVARYVSRTSTGEKEHD